jgi:hypothetical protein
MVDVPKQDRIEAHYQKSNFFRVVHADGAFGGPTPRGLVNIAFYSERTALPRRTAIPVVNGVPGPEEILESKSGVLRELEIDVIMDLAVAVSFHAWLGKVIAEAQSQLGIILPKQTT